MKSWITFQRAPRAQPRRRSDQHCRGEGPPVPQAANDCQPRPRRCPGGGTLRLARPALGAIPGRKVAAVPAPKRGGMKSRSRNGALEASKPSEKVVIAVVQEHALLTGSLVTRCWRERDSNPRSLQKPPVRKHRRRQASRVAMQPTLVFFLQIA